MHSTRQVLQITLNGYAHVYSSLVKVRGTKAMKSAYTEWKTHNKLQIKSFKVTFQTSQELMSLETVSLAYRKIYSFFISLNFCSVYRLTSCSLLATDKDEWVGQQKYLMKSAVAQQRGDGSITKCNCCIINLYYAQLLQTVGRRSSHTDAHTHTHTHDRRSCGKSRQGRRGGVIGVGNRHRPQDKHVKVARLKP